MNPKTAIVLVNWRGAIDTIACLESLACLEDPDVAVIVCDNGSGDGSAEAILCWGQRALPPRGLSVGVVSRESAGALPIADYLTIIDAGQNLGFAGGNNLGLLMALATPSVDAAWVLNNDTTVAPDALRRLRARLAEDPRLGMCGSTLVYAHDASVVQAAGGYFDLTWGAGEQIGHGGRVDALPSRDAVEARMNYVPGASILVSRAFLETVGLMDNRYFLYFEELDWALRGHPRFRLGWAPDSIVHHKEGASIGTAARGRPSDLSLYYNVVNRLRVVRRFRWPAVPVLLARSTLILTRYLIKGDRTAARITATAMLDFVRGRQRDGAWLSARRAVGHAEAMNRTPSGTAQ